MNDPVPPQDQRFEVLAHHDASQSVPDAGVSYIHCSTCLQEWRELFRGALTPKEYARQQVALTPDGIEVWCTRHEVNVDLITLRAVSKRTKAGARRSVR
jgi:hypothetical protein